ncbi:MAG: aminotransferase class IV [Saprospiraceae bacterium]
MYNLNGQLFSGIPEPVWLCQRPLYYADTLFETMRACEGRIPLLEKHWARLSGGMQALGMDVPATWSAHFFKQEVEKTNAFNARVRLTVWRLPGGKLLSEQNETAFLIETEDLPDNHFTWNNAGLRIGVAESVRLAADDFSRWKTLDIARYAQAAREAKQRGWDDALLLNGQGRVVETSICNLFWVENGAVFTPPLSEGCVAGVMRAFLLEKLPLCGINTTERPIETTELAACDGIFLTNAIRGIQWVSHWGDAIFYPKWTKTVYEQLRTYI